MEDNPARKVLYICVHNAGRSQMAAAFFDRDAPEGYIGVSAGTEPADHVHPETVEVMMEMDIDLSKERPKMLTKEMIDGAVRAITMGCMDGACPRTGIPTEDWELPDPKGRPLEEVRAIRDDIVRRVNGLIEELSS